MKEPTRTSFACGVALVTMFWSLPNAWAEISNGQIVTTTVEAELPVYSSAVEQYSQVVRAGSSTYAVAPDGNGRPQVTQISGVRVISTIIDQSDFTVPPDGHCAFSIGVDKAGYIHVTGGMHQGNPETLARLARYESEPYGNGIMNILYWKSKKPLDVSGGFAFAGVRSDSIPPRDWKSSTSIPGIGWQTGKFITNCNGDLYYYSMVKIWAASDAEAMSYAIGLYRYDTSTSLWTAIGKSGMESGSSLYKPSLTAFFWLYPDDGFQFYFCTFQFDNANRLHFATGCDTVVDVVNGQHVFQPTRLLYAYSDDNGSSWKRANGSPSAAVPGSLQSTPDADFNAIDTVAISPTPDQDSGYFGAWTSVTVDALGHPAVGNKTQWHTWNGQAWVDAGNLSGAYWGRQGSRISGDGTMYFSFGFNGHIIWTTDINQRPRSYQHNGFDQYFCLDETGLREEGALYGIGIKANSSGTVSRKSVLKTIISSAPLPPGWNSADIGTNDSGFAGFSGYSSGQYVVCDFGSVIDNNTDSFHFTYTKSDGDTVIIARILSQVVHNDAISTLARAGVMIRETLQDDSKNALMALTPNGGGIFSTRSVTNGGTIHPLVSGITAPYWIKLVRSGEIVTGYTSSDGFIWNNASSGTVIPMSRSVYVGVAGSGYQHGSIMQESAFDHVSVTPLPSTISVYATVPISTESTVHSFRSGIFTVTRTGTTMDPLTITVQMAGSATNGTDYQTIPNTIVIPSGSASVDVPVVVLSNPLRTELRTVTLGLRDGNTSYALGSPVNAVLTIAGDGSQVVNSATLDLTPSPSRIQQTLTGTLHASILTGSPVIWNWGDGSPLVTGSKIESHAYATAGTFIIEVTDADSIAGTIAVHQFSTVVVGQQSASFSTTPFNSTGRRCGFGVFVSLLFIVGVAFFRLLRTTT